MPDFHASVLPQMGMSIVGRTSSNTSGGLFKRKGHLQSGSALVMGLSS